MAHPWKHGWLPLCRSFLWQRGTYHYPSILSPNLLLETFYWHFFFIFPGSHTLFKSLMAFMNTISLKIKYTLTFSKQTLSFLDVQVYPSGSRKLRIKPTDCMTLLHFHSHHPLNCNEDIIYSQVLRYNMIISKNHILQEELSNLTSILLAHAY